MSGTRAVVRLRQIQAADLQRRAQHPELPLRASMLDLMTGCGFEHNSVHAVLPDVERLDAPVGLMEIADQRGLEDELPRRSRRAVQQLTTEWFGREGMGSAIT